MPDKVLIVNADDLGRTAGINSGVFDAHARGLVSSATLMVNFLAAKEMTAELQNYPDLGVGLHVALTRGKPTLSPEQVSSLVNELGNLPDRPEGLAEADGGQILDEVRAQLARFEELTGRLPTHLDGHHHVHRIPKVCDALMTVAKETGLPIRNAGPEVEARLGRAGVRTTDGFVERFFGSEARLDVLLEILHRLPPGTTELMCHPAYIDHELRADSSYVEERELELVALTHADARRALEAEGIRLANFSDVFGNPSGHRAR